MRTSGRSWPICTVCRRIPALAARSGWARSRVSGWRSRKYQTAAQLVRRADSVAATYPAPDDPVATGAYLARTACTECHGLDLSGGEKAPDLRIAAGYSAEAFTRLLRTGKASGDRELELMSRVARRRLSHFNDAEIQALRAYLLARAASAPRRTD